MEDIIIMIIVALVIVLAGLYIYKAKKKGKKCIGCPYSCNCSNKKNGESSCCNSCNDND